MLTMINPFKKLTDELRQEVCLSIEVYINEIVYMLLKKNESLSLTPLGVREDFQLLCFGQVGKQINKVFIDKFITISFSP